LPTTLWNFMADDLGLPCRLARMDARNPHGQARGDAQAHGERGKVVTEDRSSLERCDDIARRRLRARIRTTPSG
jgi:hypothetical protein